ncbi:MAG: SDR family oxidoreductase [Proteobacteria bacterium]|nr:SDR family oxidoreductase [Pseudomonadota bacterium]
MVRSRSEVGRAGGPAPRRTALVVGATGIAGEPLLRHLVGREDWFAYGLSRRPPTAGGALPGDSVRHIQVDLADPRATGAALAGLAEVTHVFYCGYQEHSDPTEHRRVNAAMFRNLLDAVEPAAQGLRRIVLLQGMKYYGCHLGPFKTPAEEDDPPVTTPHFYYDQQAELIRRQRGKGWTWAAARPHSICGPSVGGPMNIVATIAAYATVRKAMGLPLSFPGKPGAYKARRQVTDAAMLARAMAWMATAPECANQAFNIANGDVISWQQVWPLFAGYFDMRPGEPRRRSLARTMGNKGRLWDRLVRTHGLEPYSLDRLAAWSYGDALFGSDWDILSDTAKCRAFGFREVVDSGRMFLRLFDGLRAAGVIP